MSLFPMKLSYRRCYLKVLIKNASVPIENDARITLAVNFNLKYLKLLLCEYGAFACVPHSRVEVDL